MLQCGIFEKEVEKTLVGESSPSEFAQLEPEKAGVAAPGRSTKNGYFWLAWRRNWAREKIQKMSRWMESDGREWIFMYGVRNFGLRSPIPAATLQGSNITAWLQEDVFCFCVSKIKHSMSCQFSIVWAFLSETSVENYLERGSFSVS